MKKQLSKSEIKELNEQLKQKYNLEFFEKKDNVVLFEDGFKSVLKNNVPVFFWHENNWLPTLKSLLHNNFLKKITIDMGAVKFVASGADVMRPGIVEIDSTIIKDEVIAVIDSTHKKPLAVGLALFSGKEMQEMKQGKVIKNLHYVGDEVWKIE